MDHQTITRKCSHHQHLIIQEICLEDKCQQDRFICMICSSTNHLNDDVVCFTHNHEANLSNLLGVKLNQYHWLKDYQASFEKYKQIVKEGFKPIINKYYKALTDYFNLVNISILSIEELFYHNWKHKLAHTIYSNAYTIQQAQVAVQILTKLTSIPNLQQLLKVVLEGQAIQGRISSTLQRLQNTANSYVTKISNAIQQCGQFQQFKKLYPITQNDQKYNIFIRCWKQQYISISLLQLQNQPILDNHRNITIRKYQQLYSSGKGQNNKQKYKQQFTITRKCSTHPSKLVSFICLELECRNKRINCHDCRKHHQKHKIIQLQEDIRKFIHQFTTTSYFINHQDAPIIKQKIQKLKNNLKQSKSKSIDTFLELYINTNLQLFYHSMIFHRKPCQDILKILLDENYSQQQLEKSFQILKNYRQKLKYLKDLQNIKQLTQYITNVLHQLFNVDYLDKIQQAIQQQIQTRYIKNIILRPQSLSICNSIAQKQKKIIYKSISLEVIDYLNIQTKQQLLLNNRKIGQIQGLQNFKSLLQINLNKNTIPKIINLGTLTKLTSLDLDTNCIQKIDNLNSLENLIILKLGYNKIKKIENLSNLKNLKELSLDGNQLTYIQNLQQLTELQTINFDQNQIKAMQNLQKNLKLNIIFLSQNKITEIKQFPTLTLLTSIFLENNPINKNSKDTILAIESYKQRNINLSIDEQ